MGCCLATPSPPPSPSPTPRTPLLSSSPHIPYTSPSRPRIPSYPYSDSHYHSHSHSHPRPRHHPPRALHPSGPLTPPISLPLTRPPWCTTHPWTPTTLDIHRAEFFDTRTSGHTEIWQAIHLALSLLWPYDRSSPGSDSGSGSASTSTLASQFRDQDHDRNRDPAANEALETARSILDAAGVILPTGDLSEGGYDATGFLYRIPPAVISDPVNLNNNISIILSSLPSTTTPSTHTPPTIPKEPLSSTPTLQLTVRLSTVQDVTVTVPSDMLVQNIASVVEGAAGIRADRRVKLIYLGRALNDGDSLDEQGWVAGHVVNGMVVPKNRWR